MRDGELGGADWVGEVDVEAGVAVGCGTVFRRGFAGREPEIRIELCMDVRVSRESQSQGRGRVF